MKNFNWYRIGKLGGIFTLLYFGCIWEDPNMSLNSYLQKVMWVLITITIYELRVDVNNLKNK